MQADQVVIVGAGPAGIAAAIQLQRSKVPFTLLEKERIGGLLWNANLVENYPGFPNGISGPKLVSLLEKQMQRIGVEVTFDRALYIEPQVEEYLVETEQTSYRPRYLILATGTKPRPIPINIPIELHDRISSEVYPLLGTRDQHIVIVGAGDAAFDYALNLAKHNMVSIMHRGEQINCLPLLWERASENSKISFQDCTTIEQVTPGGSRTNLHLKGKYLGKEFEIETNYLVYAIGREPEIDLISPDLLAEQSKLVTSKRLFLVGDVVNGYMRQTAIAVGDGLRAAMQIHADINITEVRTS